MSRKYYLKRLMAVLLATALAVPSTALHAFAGNTDYVKNTTTTIDPNNQYVAAMDKKAERTGEGEYKITLSVTGKEISVNKDVDVVFVLDNSESMKGNRIQKANEAIEAFMNVLAPNNESHIRFGLVKFGEDAKSEASLASGKTHVSKRLNSALNGGTNTQAGLAQGGAMLKNSSADRKIVVLLTDGAPTYHNQVTAVKYTDNPIRKYGSNSGDYGNRMASAFSGRRSGSGYYFTLKKIWGVSRIVGFR